MNLVLRFFSISLFLLILTGCSGKKDNFIVYNQDTETIDSLFIMLEGRTYFIEDLKYRQTKSLYISKMYDTDIFIQASDSVLMKLPVAIQYPQEKTIRLMITKSGIISAGAVTN